MQSRRWLEDENEAEDWRSQKNRGLHTILWRLSQAVMRRCSVNSFGLPLNPASARRGDEQLNDAQLFRAPRT